MGTQGTGRKRSTKKERTTAEDDALDLIAREAEARLAAKRAARAEAREIRMKELERQQKELSDDDERMSVGSRGSVRVEDREYLEKGSRAASALTAATLTSLGGTSSRRGSGETAITADAETSIREIKDALAEVEEKYRKAMVSNAQLDNEKTNLIYQVDTLKDSLMELEELLSESRRAFEEKVKECEREKHAHGVLQFQFNDLKETLKQSEELLNESRQLRMKQDGFVREISDLQETLEWKDKKIGALERQKEYTDAIRNERDELREEVVNLKDILKKHGIVLGPDLTVNGDMGEAEVDGPPSGDAAPDSAQNAQTSPGEGNSMLGNAEENQLRSSIKEEVQQEQHRESWKEETKESNLWPDALCSVAGVSKPSTSSEEPTEKPHRISPTEDANTEESNVLSIGPVTEAKDSIICSPASPQLENIVCAEERELSNAYLEENKSRTTGTERADSREAFEAQGNRKEALKNTEMCHQQNTQKNVPNESALAPSNAECQQEVENVVEEENSETEELASKTLSMSQGATASGKKKKKKRRGKKNKNQQKDETQKEDSQTNIEVELAKGGTGSTTERKSSSATKGFKEQKMEQGRQESEGLDPAQTKEPTEEEPSGPQMDHATNEHTEQTLESKTVEEVEVVLLPESHAHTESPQETRTHASGHEQHNEQPLESENIEKENLSAPEVLESPASEAFQKSEMNQVDNEQHRQESEGLAEAETVESTERFSCNEMTTHHVTNDHTEPSLTTETVEVDAVAPTKTLAHIERTVGTSSAVSKDEQDEGQTLEREKVENLETTLSISNLTDTSEDTEGTVSPENQCPSSLNTSDRQPANNEEVGDRAPEVVCHVEIDAERADEIQAACTASDPGRYLVTNCRENTQSNGDKAADGLESTNCQSVSVGSSGSELESSVTITVSARESEEAVEMITEQEECYLYSHDDKDPESKQGGTEKETPAGRLMEDEASHRCDRATLTTNAGLDTEEGLSQSVVEAEQLVKTESQTESNVECSETDELNTAMSNATAPIKQESSVEHDEDRETSPLDERLHSADSAQPIRHESDSDCCEDEEGQSFDFDDMDAETAIPTNVSSNLDQEEAEDAIEVMADESHNVISADEKTQEKPVEASDEKCKDEEAPLGKRSHDSTQGSKNSKTEQEEVVADEARCLEDGKAVNDGELCVDAQKMKQVASVPVDEGLDAIKHEMQNEGLVLPRGEDEGAKELQQAAKDGKKNSKKGKGKSKEECKMS